MKVDDSQYVLEEMGLLRVILKDRLLRQRKEDFLDLFKMVKYFQVCIAPAKEHQKPEETAFIK